MHVASEDVQQPKGLPTAASIGQVTGESESPAPSKLDQGADKEAVLEWIKKGSEASDTIQGEGTEETEEEPKNDKGVKILNEDDNHNGDPVGLKDDDFDSRYSDFLTIWHLTNTFQVFPLH